MTDYIFKYLTSQEELDQFGEIEKIEITEPLIHPITNTVEFDNVTIVYKNGVRVDIHSCQCERLMFYAEMPSDIPAEIRSQFKFRGDENGTIQVS